MQRKPKSCEGCPFMSKGKEMGFVADDIPSTAKVVLVFDSPDFRFSGDTARDVGEAKYFRSIGAQYLGLEEWEVGYAHILRCKHVNGSTGKPLSVAKQHCRQYDEFNDDSTVLAVGPMAWKLLTHNEGGSRQDWRSFYVQSEYDWNQKPARPEDFTRDTSGLDDLFAQQDSKRGTPQGSMNRAVKNKGVDPTLPPSTLVAVPVKKVE